MKNDFHPGSLLVWEFDTILCIGYSETLRSFYCLTLLNGKFEVSAWSWSVEGYERWTQSNEHYVFNPD